MWWRISTVVITSVCSYWEHLFQFYLCHLLLWNYKVLQNEICATILRSFCFCNSHYLTWFYFWQWVRILCECAIDWWLRIPLVLICYYFFSGVRIKGATTSSLPSFTEKKRFQFASKWWGIEGWEDTRDKVLCSSCSCLGQTPLHIHLAPLPPPPPPPQLAPFKREVTVSERSVLFKDELQLLLLLLFVSPSLPFALSFSIPLLHRPLFLIFSEAFLWG